MTLTANPEMIQQIHRAAITDINIDGGNREFFMVQNLLGAKYYIKLTPVDTDNYSTTVQYKSADSGILWDIVPIDEFCEMYLNVKSLKPWGFTTSFEEISKMKAEKFFNKNGKIMWIDSDGYIYLARKSDSPTKKKTDLFKKYGGKSGAVYVCITENNKKTYQWFNSLREANEAFEKIMSRRIGAFDTPSMRLLADGSSLHDPKKTKLIYRYPMFNLEYSLKLKSESTRQETIERIALEWRKEIIRQGSVADIEELKTIITAYCDYIEKTERK